MAENPLQCYSDGGDAEMAETGNHTSGRDINPMIGYSGDRSEYPDQQHPSPSQQITGGVDDGVPRDSNMWIAAAYNITAIVGVGVLGIPQAMALLTWSWGVVILLLAFFITYFSMKQLIKLHEFEVDNKKIRYVTYRSLGERAFGEKKGFWIVVPLQMTVEVSLDILFTVAAGEAMHRIHNLWGCHRELHIFIWFAVFATIQLILSALVRSDFESRYLRGLVTAAAIMSICYTTTAWIAVVSIGGSPKGPRIPPIQQHSYIAPAPGPDSQHLTSNHIDHIFRAFNAIGVIAFAYATHNIILEIQNGIPLKRDRKGTLSSEPEMLRGVQITYFVVAICYFPMAIAVYAIHGDLLLLNPNGQNVLSFIQYQLQQGASENGRKLVIAINLMLIIHLIGSYQIFAVPVFKELEIFSQPAFKNSYPVIRRNPSIIIRPLYIVFTTLLAMIFPDFSALLGFFGGFAIAPTTYFLPCIIWLLLKMPPSWKSKNWYFNWVCIILGVTLMLVGTSGGLYVFVKDSSIFNSYKLWGRNWNESTIVSCMS